MIIRIIDIPSYVAIHVNFMVLQLAIYCSDIKSANSHLTILYNISPYCVHYIDTSKLCIIVSLMHIHSICLSRGLELMQSVKLLYLG